MAEREHENGEDNEANDTPQVRAKRYRMLKTKVESLEARFNELESRAPMEPQTQKALRLLAGGLMGIGVELVRLGDAPEVNASVVKLRELYEQGLIGKKAYDEGVEKAKSLGTSIKEKSEALVLERLTLLLKKMA